MKTRKLMAAALGLVLAGSLAACGGSSSPASTTAAPTTAAPAATEAAAPAGADTSSAETGITPRTYEVASGSSTGAYYLQITPIAALWENLDFVKSCSVQATTGALENTVLVSTGQADAGLTDAFAYFAAQEGTDPYSEPYTGYSAIAAGAPSICHIIVRADSDIHSIADLKGHSIAVGASGSGAEFEERFMLEALGITYDDLSQVDMVGIGPGLTNFQDGKDDAVILLSGAGNSNVMEAMTNVDIRLLSFTDEELKTVLDACPFFVADTIPAGSYDGLEEDIQSCSVACVLIASDNLSEEEVYNMTDMIYKNIDSLKTANVNFEKWTFGPGCAGNVPLHKGAEKYYSDNNITVD